MLSLFSFSFLFFFSVFSGSLEWEPQADQDAGEPLRPVYDDILIAKLRPGQGIHVKCYVHKGIGKDHAKFSPVATASYRLVPHLRILDESKMTPELAERIANTCPMSVFSVEDGKVKVENPLACTKCRECTRGDLENVVELSHFTTKFISIFI